MPRALTHQPSEDHTPCVVLDNGSAFIKAGFAGDEEPRAIVATSGLAEAGDVQPISRGVVQNWDAMEAYWDQAFMELRIDTAECNLLVTSPLFDPKDNKEHLMQTLFETFAVPGAYTTSPAILELYAAGRENGVVVGCGAQCTYAVLVHEGLPDPRTQFRSDVAGDALTAYTAKVLQAANGGGVDIDLETARRAKETLAAVAADSSGAPAPHAAGPAQFDLPDGKKLTVSAAARAEMAEPLFQPLMVGEHGGGLAQLVAEAIHARDRDGALESTEHGKDGTDNWYRSIVLAGGTTMIPGLEARLGAELARHAPKGCTPEVLAPPQRKHAAWLGGSILASLAVVSQMWITKEEYDENGPLIVHRKTF